RDGPERCAIRSRSWPGLDACWATRRSSTSRKGCAKPSLSTARAATQRGASERAPSWSRRSRHSVSRPGHTLENLAQLIEAERLEQHGPIGLLQRVARLQRDRVAGGEHDTPLPSPPFLPQLLEQIEARVL